MPGAKTLIGMPYVRHAPRAQNARGAAGSDVACERTMTCCRLLIPSLLSLSIGCGSSASNGGAVPTLVPGSDAVLRANTGVVETRFDIGSNGTALVGLSARFVTSPSGCVVLVEEGGCWVARCERLDAKPSPGKMVLTGPALASALTWEPTNTFSHTVTVPASAAGTFLLKTAGADVPAFEAQATRPAVVALLSPAARSTALARSDGFDVTWSPVDADYVQGQLFSTVAQSAQVAECWWPAVDGRGTIPPGILAVLDTSSWDFIPKAVRMTTSARGAYDVSVRWSTSDGTSRTLSFPANSAK